MAEAALVIFIAVSLVLWALSELIAYVDRNRPRRDYVAERKRTITRNAFKSRIGRPYREYR
jgi:hypothetical protein